MSPYSEMNEKSHNFIMVCSASAGVSGQVIGSASKKGIISGNVNIHSVVIVDNPGIETELTESQEFQLPSKDISYVNIGHNEFSDFAMTGLLTCDPRRPSLYNLPQPETGPDHCC